VSNVTVQPLSLWSLSSSTVARSRIRTRRTLRAGAASAVCMWAVRHARSTITAAAMVAAIRRLALTRDRRIIACEAAARGCRNSASMTERGQRGTGPTMVSRGVSLLDVLPPAAADCLQRATFRISTHTWSV
jgi:hypothetical protein